MYQESVRGGFSWIGRALDTVAVSRGREHTGIHKHRTPPLATQLPHTPPIQVVAHKDVEPMLLDATAFSRLPTTPPSLPPHYRILLKEVIHHIPTHEYAGMFAGLAQRMALGGVVLVVTRPQVVDYPLFDLAREVMGDGEHDDVVLAASVCMLHVHTSTGMVCQSTTSRGDCSCHEGGWVTGVCVQGWFVCRCMCV